MRKILILFLFVNFSAVAQISGTVTDSISGKPIPYANITIDGKAIGMSSEADGSYKIDIADPNTELVFSAIGFTSAKVKISKSGNVKLKPEVYELDEIPILKSLGKTKIEIGDSKKSGLPQFSFGKMPWIFAKYFPYKETYGENRFVKDAVVTTSSEIDGALFRLRIMAVGEDGNPGEDIVPENIIIPVKKGSRKNIIDLTKYHITIPGEGIFIAFEHLFIEQNRVFFKKDGKQLPTDGFEPRILTYEAEREYTYMSGNGSWAKQRKRPSPTQVLWEPAINLILTN
ncbi:carboxypeptidase-like regulatory domain-containing protein [Flavobacterium sp. 3HN19-14]|uniref:carboxypeptidase-like regulatory domain-containing protein n=1 Tax=Flavobacterium sp. 3HN19-14 TaxID=3448133 RepID=UPI003EDF7D73